MDRISPQRRSWNMSRIRSSGTAPELTVRSILHRLGLRFRVNRRELPGCPDIVLKKHRTVVFVHGCFWHQHRNCQFAYTPKTRIAFWERKFSANQERDGQVAKSLRASGWRVITVWECETKNEDKIRSRLRRLFPSTGKQTL
ncbi:MAG: DNA mismatch endonuclease Vsr [Pseudomonadota bacterium]|nr:DNA mismatch endonuclease Vsr [Pseudomonadota bacterium]